MTLWRRFGRLASFVLAAAAVGLLLAAVGSTRSASTLRAEARAASAPAAKPSSARTTTPRGRHGVNAAAAIAAAPPACNDFSFITPVNTTLANSVSCTDPDGDPLTYGVDFSPSSGLVVLNANGSFTYMPNSGFSGDDAFGFSASDGTSETFGVVTVRVGPNGAPVATDDSFTVRTATARQLFVLDNDTDPEDDSLHIAANTNPAHGSVTCDRFSCTYTSDPAYVGPDSFTYTAADDFGGQDTATVSLTVELNQPPVATDDDYTVTGGIAKQLFVLENDTDPDGDPLHIAANTNPAHGGVTCDQIQCTYTATAGYVGPDSFTYTAADDSGAQDIATVSLTVEANQPPVAVNDTLEVAQDAGATRVDVLANDTDPNDDDLSVTGSTDPAHGTATCDQFACEYTPDPGYSGPDSFDYTVSDSLATDTGTVQISVFPKVVSAVTSDSAGAQALGQAMEATPGSITSASFDTIPPEGTPNGVGSGALNSFPTNGGTFAVLTSGDATLADDPNTAPDSGTNDGGGNIRGDTDFDVSILKLGVSVPTGANCLSFDFKFYSDEFPEFVNTEFNDAFIAELDSSTWTTSGSTISAPNNFAFDPSHDVISINSSGNTAMSAAEAAGTTYDGATPLLTAGTQVTPGMHTLYLSIFDQGDHVYDSAVFLDNLRVGFVPDPATQCGQGAQVKDFELQLNPPTAQNTVGSPHTVTATLQTETGSPVPGATISFNVTGANTGSGTATTAVDGTAQFTYTGTSVGTDSIVACYDANANGTCDTGDAIASATKIWVPPPNRDPVAVDDAYTVALNATLIATAPGVLGNDSDPDGDPLTVSAHTNPAHGTLTINADGSLAYTPDAAFCGPDSFTYTVSDGRGGSDTATVSITVTCAINNPPNAVDDAYSTDESTTLTVAAPGVLGNDFDPDFDPLTVSAHTNPAHGTLTINADGSFVYTPAAGFCGSDSFTYTASDGRGGTDTATVSLSVACVNHAPNAVDDSYLAFENGSLSVAAPGVLANDSDSDGDPLTVSAHTNPAHGTLTINPDGSFTYTPAAGFCGSDSFTYTISDGHGGTDTATVSISIACVNVPPHAVDDAYTTTEDTTLTVAAPGVLGNDTDADDDPLTVSAHTNPAHGTLTINPDGSFTYTPAGNYCGPDSFTYTISDGHGGTDTATVSITVTCVNDNPVAVDDSYQAFENGSLSVAAPGVLGNDSDPDGDPLTLSAHTNPAHGTLTINPDGSFTYTPATGFCGPDSFTYTISDGHGGTDTATVSISVACVNVPPHAVDDAYTTTEDTTLTVPAPGVLANDTDADHDPLTVSAHTNPAHGTLTINPDGSFTYTPAGNYCGPDSFTYTANDGHGGTDTATASITVTCVNHAPNAVDDAYTTNQDTALTVNAPGVLANDTDPDGDALTVGAHTNPAHGTLTINPDGSFTYSPNNGFNGVDSFTYTSSDGHGGTDIATVTLTVVASNHPPTCSSVTATPNVLWSPNHKFELVTLSGGSDPDGDPLTITITGVLQNEPAGKGEPDTQPGPTANQVYLRAERSGKGSGRVYTIMFTVSDGQGGTCDGSLTVSVAHDQGSVGNAGVATMLDAQVDLFRVTGLLPPGWFRSSTFVRSNAAG
jgi:VCBS repeat-containing protein